jgi:hypothetical protein
VITKAAARASGLRNIHLARDVERLGDPGDGFERLGRDPAPDVAGGDGDADAIDAALDRGACRPSCAPSLARERSLGHRDAFQLALAAHVGLEGGEDRQHAEERAPRSGRGVDILLDHLQMRSRLLDLMGDAGKIAQGAAPQSR